ncbi:MAG: hypothetical protein V4714_13710 [Bacteroidota bacterium]
MTKKILAIYYSQTGQLGDILDNFTTPLLEAGISVEKVRVKPVKDFVFPWTKPRFFDAMPESVLGVPVELQPFTLKEASYDLVIFAYQPWFLSPSIPATSILHHPAFKKVLKDTPVVTLIGARNMWLNAQEKVKVLLKQAEATLVGNVVLVNRNNNYVSAVTIFYWMLKGKTDRYLGVFPKPTITEADIAQTKVFGSLVKNALGNGDWNNLQPLLVKEKALEVKWDLMFIEARAGKLFSMWANLITRKKNRAFWLVLYKYYLLIALFMVAPLVVGIYGVIFKPFFGKSINKKKQFYLGVN